MVDCIYTVCIIVILNFIVKNCVIWLIKRENVQASLMVFSY